MLALLGVICTLIGVAEPELMVIVAVARLVEFATLVAVTVAVVLFVTDGAVYIPELEILPALVDQVTAFVEASLTVAANCCVPPDVRLVLPGVIWTLTVEDAAVMETTALALFVVSATLVAVTVAEVALETVGAVNFPSWVMLPVVVAQVTDVLLVPLTNALNCWVPADDTLELFGDTEIPTLPVEGLFTVRPNVFSRRLEEESITSTRT
jgi:hypothetical protein